MLKEGIATVLTAPFFFLSHDLNIPPLYEQKIPKLKETVVRLKVGRVKLKEKEPKLKVFLLDAF